MTTKRYGGKRDDMGTSEMLNVSTDTSREARVAAAKYIAGGDHPFTKGDVRELLDMLGLLDGLADDLEATQEMP